MSKLSACQPVWPSVAFESIPSGVHMCQFDSLPNCREKDQKHARANAGRNLLSQWTTQTAGRPALESSVTRRWRQQSRHFRPGRLKYRAVGTASYGTAIASDCSLDGIPRAIRHSITKGKCRAISDYFNYLKIVNSFKMVFEIENEIELSGPILTPK